MVLSKGRTWNLLKLTVLMAFCSSFAYAQGTCPSGAPVTGNNCYFVAASGADINNGTSESTPWLHAPGMPNCTGVCASAFPTQYTSHAGIGIIFRGGDTWHFGNSAASPYVGGTWLWTFDGSSTNCDTSDNPSAVRTSCIYIGVDQTWYSGSAWARPIMSGDNPTNTSPVASCAYGNVGSKGQFLVVNNEHFAWFDNFEWTGMCQQTASSSSNNYLFDWYLYIVDVGGGSAVTQNIYSNHYAHGFTHLAFSCSDSGGEPVGQCFTAGWLNPGTASTVGPANVCDFWDSDPTSVGCLILGGGYLIYDNVFADQAQVVVDGCHDVHDNFWFNYYPTGDGVAHGNQFECNSDAPIHDSDGNYQPAGVYNVFYNNILGHNYNTPGDIKIQLAANNTYSEYWFNNTVYDQGSGNNWDVGCTGCTEPTTGTHQYMFNNTVDLPPGQIINCSSSMVATANHVITESGTGFASGCAINNPVVMNHSTAEAQGYMAAGTGKSGSNGNTTCANDITPCSPTVATNSTVGAGAILQSYCTALQAANDTADGLDIVRAGDACASATTDACSYNVNTRSVSCPSRTAMPRPQAVAWDAGAYQFGQAPQAPQGLVAIVN